MKTATKIMLAAAIAVAIFAIIVLIRFFMAPSKDYEQIKMQQEKQEQGKVKMEEIKTATTSGKQESEVTWQEQYSSADNWTVFELPDGVEIANPFTFNGTTTAFENNINWSLEDENGAEIASGFAYVNSPDMGIPGPFTIKAFIDKIPQTETGTLKVFESSAKDGSPLHVAEAQVIFPTETQTVTVYFSNTKEDPSMMDCSKVYPVERMVLAGDTAEIAIHELLRGPLATEEKAGFVTQIPKFVTQPIITYTKAGMSLDFLPDLESEVGGSCRVSAIRAQLEETAKKASNEQTVIISIDGRTQDILQP
ncbi:MAG: Gmad2 immunoglobulin-like domain-containing protein [Patescibacteria group bacterium]